MGRKKKKYLITTEHRETFIIRRNENKTVCEFCPECQEQVELLTLDAVTSQTGISTRRLFQMIENKDIHSVETEGGHLLVCLSSLKI